MIQKEEAVKIEDPMFLEVWQQDKIEVTQTKIIERLTFRKIVLDIAASFNFEKGMLSTIKGLTIHPAKTIKSYLDKGRYEVTSPIKYFLLIVGLTILIGSLTNYYLIDTHDLQANLSNGLEEHVKTKTSPDGTITTSKSYTFSPKNNIEIISFLNDMAIKYSNVFGLVTILIFSILSFLLFRSANYNFVEHLCINTYLYSHTSIWLLFLVIIGSQNIQLIFLQSLLYFIMSLVVYSSLFNNSHFVTFLKTFGIMIVNGILGGIIALISIFIYLYSSGILDKMFQEMGK